jgi:hypothetical protein
MSNNAKAAAVGPASGVDNKPIFGSKCSYSWFGSVFVHERAATSRMPAPSSRLQLACSSSSSVKRESFVELSVSLS